MLNNEGMLVCSECGLVNDNTRQLVNPQGINELIEIDEETRALKAKLNGKELSDKVINETIELYKQLKNKMNNNDVLNACLFYTIRRNNVPITTNDLINLIIDNPYFELNDLRKELVKLTNTSSKLRLTINGNNLIKSEYFEKINLKEAVNYYCSKISIPERRIKEIINETIFMNNVSINYIEASGYLAAMLYFAYNTTLYKYYGSPRFDDKLNFKKFITNGGKIKDKHLTLSFLGDLFKVTPPTIHKRLEVILGIKAIDDLSGKLHLEDELRKEIKEEFMNARFKNSIRTDDGYALGRIITINKLMRRGLINNYKELFHFQKQLKQLIKGHIETDFNDYYFNIKELLSNYFPKIKNTLYLRMKSLMID